MVSKSLKKVLFVISFFYIFINTKILVANEWLNGNVGVFQGLDKITARIKTFEIQVGIPKKFGVLTPASGIGKILIKRLKTKGIIFKVN